MYKSQLFIPNPCNVYKSIIRVVPYHLFEDNYIGYIVMLCAQMFRSLIPVLKSRIQIKEWNIRVRNITI